MTLPPAIRHGAIRAYFIYDVADTVDLRRLDRIAGTGVEQAPLQLRSVLSAAYIQFPTPPLAARLAPTSVLGREAATRAKIYDYGVVSLRLSLPYEGSWEGFARLAQRLRQGEELAGEAARLLEGLLAEIAPALAQPHGRLVEDYFVLEVQEFEAPIGATELLASCASAVASLVSAETEALGEDEQREALRVRFSYFERDLAVVQWDAAFIYDTREGAEAIADILEFANTQLVEFRAYDARLDAELDAIYAMDIPRRRPNRLFELRSLDRRAQLLRSLVVDVRELADRATNALKIIGDAYYARLYRGTAGRLSLGEWQGQVDSKLASINEVYRFLTDQAQNARAEFLEIVIIVLIAAEIVVGVLALHR
ncbi:MAG TPA: hypothetical protein VNJ51_07075 [Candidatus Dormibacteraeota bacterium]|nr:hypothetical protein [Candidatus Dormibacteraeota bacterium]